MRANAQAERVASCDLTRERVQEQALRFLTTVDALWDSDFNAQSMFPQLTNGYVVTHVARCADRYADELYAARTGRAFPVDADRRFPEGVGALRPGAVLIEDASVALERLLAELCLNGATGSVAPEECRIPLEALVEIVLHHADLGSPLNELDHSLVQTILAAAVTHTRSAPSWPDVAMANRTQPRLTIGAGPAQTTVFAEWSDLLAWLTGRSNAAVSTTDGRPPPPLPLWECYRTFVPDEADHVSSSS